MRAGRGRAYARTALAGNPSDAYGGRTLAVGVLDFAATAEVEPARALRIEVGDGDASGIEPLVRAALTRFAAATGHDVAPAVSVRTTVPRQVGLAGSSAIVIAVLRALATACAVELDGDTLAREALAAETEELGIAAGPQDRLVQARGGLLYMDFATGGLEVLSPSLLPPLFIAHRLERGEPSGTVHRALRRRFEAGEPDVLAAMRALAETASAAREALVAGDRDAFARCLDVSLDLRAGIVELDPRDRRGADIARAHGASVNYTGSGGAVVGVLPEPESDALARDLAAAGWALVERVFAG